MGNKQRVGNKEQVNEMEEEVTSEEVQHLLQELFEKQNVQVKDQIMKLATDGNTDMIFGLCTRIVTAWDHQTDVFENCKKLEGGLTGAGVYLVARKQQQQGPSSSSTSSNKVVFKIANFANDDELACLTQPGKANGMLYVANKSVSNSNLFADVWQDELLPRCTVLEFLEGTSFETPVKSHGLALRTKEDAIALGKAIALFHQSSSSSTSSWYNNNTFNIYDRYYNTFTNDLKEVVDQIPSDEMMIIDRAATVQGLTYINEIVPILFKLLSPDSLMGRMVVGHNDLHDGNLMRRYDNNQPGDLVLIDFDRICMMQAGNDLGSYMSQIDTSKVESPWPSYEMRASFAQSYIDTMPEEVISNFSRTSVDEVIFDLEIGCVMRDLYLGMVIPMIFPPIIGKWVSQYLVNERVIKCTNVLIEARNNEQIRNDVLKHGIRHVANINGLTLGNLFKSFFTRSPTISKI